MLWSFKNHARLVDLHTKVERKALATTVVVLYAYIWAEVADCVELWLHFVQLHVSSPSDESIAGMSSYPSHPDAVGQPVQVHMRPL